MCFLGWVINSPQCVQSYNVGVDESHCDVVDRFAQFFLTPLFNASATDREVKAVDSGVPLGSRDTLCVSSIQFSFSPRERPQLTGRCMEDTTSAKRIVQTRTPTQKISNRYTLNLTAPCTCI